MNISKGAKIFGLLCIFFTICSVTGSAIQVNTQTVTMTTIDDTISVKETLVLDPQGDSLQNIIFYLPEKATDIQIFVNAEEISYQKTDTNHYQCNLSKYSVNQTLTITIDYFLPRSIQTYENTIQYTTDSLIIKFDGSTIYESKNLTDSSSFSISLIAAEETASLINIYIIILIVLLIVLLVVSLAYGMKKKRRPQERSRDLESNELLSVEKTLMMDMLKQIEKLHRTEKISDETYQKLKSHYKQQTVEIMSNIDAQNSDSKK